jgi:prepilin-type N-terminal cleavage/methylation domain-containing protein
MRARSFTLIEVVVALALLSGLGMWLVQLQLAAMRQYHEAMEQLKVADRVEHMLWNWSMAGAEVTLPSSGHWDERYGWRREVLPVRIGGAMARQIRVIVTRSESGQSRSDVYDVAWLVPARRSRR